MSAFSRRQLLRAGAAGGLMGMAAAGRSAGRAAGASAIPPAPSRTADELAHDEAYWARVAEQYLVTDRITNLENGNWGIMSQPVLSAYVRHTERVNRDNAYFARREYSVEYRRIHTLLADRLGVGEDEIALTRGATEALQGIIGGFHRLGRGDTVMYADLDYGSIIQTLVRHADRVGARSVKLAVPEAAGRDALIATYTEAMDRHPRTQLLLLTHVSHRTGLLLPVREICAAARQRGIRTVVDAAHSWGQVPFRAPELDADYIGFNLHKWVGAPLGVGVMYIRRERLDDIAPNLAATDSETDSIRGRVHTGTSNFAAVLTVPDAFAFQDLIGWEAKAARLRHLRSLWVSRVRRLPGVEILTPDDPNLHAGMTSFRLAGRVTDEANRAIAERLLEEFGIFTVQRGGVAAGSCVRVTPTVYNSAADMAKLGRALEQIA